MSDPSGVERRTPDPTIHPRRPRSGHRAGTSGFERWQARPQALTAEGPGSVDQPVGIVVPTRDVVPSSVVSGEIAISAHYGNQFGSFSLLKQFCVA